MSASAIPGFIAPPSIYETVLPVFLTALVIGGIGSLVSLNRVRPVSRTTLLMAFFDGLYLAAIMTAVIAVAHGLRNLEVAFGWSLLACALVSGLLAFAKSFVERAVGYDLMIRRKAELLSLDEMVPRRPHIQNLEDHA